MAASSKWLFLACLVATSGFSTSSSDAASEWQHVPFPAGKADHVQIANANEWMVNSYFDSSVDVTHDAGSHWNHVELPDAPDAYPIGAAADGTMEILASSYVSGVHQFRLYRLGGNFVPIQIGPVISGNILSPGRTAVADDGTAFITYQDAFDHQFKLMRVTVGGASTIATLPAIPDVTSWSSVRTALGVRLLPGKDFTTPQKWSGGTYRVDGDEVVNAEKFPVDYIDGDFEVSAVGDAESWDHGNHWSQMQFGGSVLQMIEKAPGLGMPDHPTIGNSVGERFSPSLFRASGLTLPTNISGQVVDVGSSFIAWSTNGLYVTNDELPPLPQTIGDIAPDAIKMVDRANQFRADSGLPPLTIDSSLSLAANNHSKYTKLNPDELKGLSAHNERSGHDGFTGIEPWDRCEAVGTTCKGEVMFGDGEEDPAGGWLATVFHQPLLASPESGVVGAGKVDGGWSVMDYRQNQNVMIQPVGFPNGRWRGENGFTGEIPDPVDGCKSNNTPVTYPVGIAITLYIPSEAATGSVSEMKVRREGTAKDMVGCLLNDSDLEDHGTGAFITDDPLIAGETYDVSAMWSPGGSIDEDGNQVSGSAPSFEHKWSFTYQPDDYKGNDWSKPQCLRPKLTFAKSSSKRSPGQAGTWTRGVRLSLSLNSAATVQLQHARLSYRKHKRWKGIKFKLGSFADRKLDIGKDSTLSFRLDKKIYRRLPKHGTLPVLTFNFRATPTTNRCASTANLSRTIRVRPGWVRLSSKAAWTN